MTRDGWLPAIASDLASVANVAGVVLGGSRARGTHNALSDYDIAVYYHDDIDPEAVQAVLTRYHDEGEELTVTVPGEWGPWINGGAWFKVGGIKADLLYREAGVVMDVIAKSREGEFSVHYQIGHPAAYYSYMLAAEAGVFRELRDVDGTLAELKAMVQSYPEKLRHAIIDKFMFEADFQLSILERSDNPDDIFFVQAGMVRTVSCFVQVIYALNEAWYVNEKRSVAEASTMPLIPAAFGDRISRGLSGDAGSVDEGRALHEDMEALVQHNLPAAE